MYDVRATLPPTHRSAARAQLPYCLTAVICQLPHCRDLPTCGYALPRDARPCLSARTCVYSAYMAQMLRRVSSESVVTITGQVQDRPVETVNAVGALPVCPACVSVCLCACMMGALHGALPECLCACMVVNANTCLCACMVVAWCPACVPAWWMPCLCALPVCLHGCECQFLPVCLHGG